MKDNAFLDELFEDAKDEQKFRKRYRHFHGIPEFEKDREFKKAMFGNPFYDPFKDYNCDRFVDYYERKRDKWPVPSKYWPFDF